MMDRLAMKQAPHINTSGREKFLQRSRFSRGLLENNAILTKEVNMIKRKWKGDPSCYFCNQLESMLIYSTLAV